MKTHIAFLLLFFSMSCKEDDLPKPTQNGSGTFACKVNGNVYLPSNQDFKRSAKTAILRSDNSFTVAGVNDNPDLPEAVIVNIENFIGTGTYELSSKDIDNFGTYRVEDQNYYYTNDVYTGKVTITHFDKGKKIVSGTFDYRAQDPETLKVVHVSDGRFDLRYN